jgi:hypothetical protein
MLAWLSVSFVALSVQDSLYSGVPDSLRMMKGYVWPASLAAMLGNNSAGNNYAGAGSR